MKFKLIKSFLLTLILVLSFSTLTFATSTGTQVNKTVDGVKASLTFTSEKLKTGSNDFTILLQDENNQPITATDLKVTADMDRSSGMDDGMKKADPMMLDLKAGSQAGQYTGTVDFSNKGNWIIKATFDVQGQAKTVDLNFNVQGTGPNYFIIGGFGGVILLVIVVAAIFKKKSSQA